ncbi:phytochrome A-associated F-box protein [Tripterygium wilfordii]|uniref:phytochrome A-associated F-box protein n=1 Tax=Tripterygium wilfordii TaxID=458696 RepID=UPI0018F7E77E|nr:phytochrome A-associated F-box protein [Tripterygium wilfordii]
MTTMAETTFSKLSDDVVLNIFSKLEDDPRHWARLACVCTKFSSLIRNICWKDKCNAAIPAVVSDLLFSSSSAPPGGWAALFKLSVCCPGLLNVGFLFKDSDFGLERELGPDENFSLAGTAIKHPCSNCDLVVSASAAGGAGTSVSDSDCSWSMYDDLYFDTVYDVSEGPDAVQSSNEEVVEKGYGRVGHDFHTRKRRKICRLLRSHLASGVWNLSREQGNKLLASQFRDDCLYICDFPGCIHIEEKRNYMLFRGVFKNFKRSRVWRTINDGNRRKIDLNCAFCACNETWDLHSAFCLRRVFRGFHDDGDPIVRAYVCENGHVSGAWTDLPLYT